MEKPITKEEIVNALYSVGFETLFVDGEDFDRIGEAFEQSNAVNKAMIGKAELCLMD